MQQHLVGIIDHLGPHSRLGEQHFKGARDHFDVVVMGRQRGHDLFSEVDPVPVRFGHRRPMRKPHLCPRWASVTGDTVTGWGGRRECNRDRAGINIASPRATLRRDNSNADMSLTQPPNWG